MFPSVVEQENLGYLVIAQGRRIADFNCQQEIVRIEKQYATSQQALDDENRKKRTELLEHFDANKKKLKESFSQKRIMLASVRKDKCLRINTDRKPKIENLEKQQADEDSESQKKYQEQLQLLESDFQKSQTRTVRRWIEGCQYSSDFMLKVREQSLQDLPDWNSKRYINGDWPRLSEYVGLASWNH